MSSASKIIQAAAGNAGEALYVEDVFSTYLYEGDGSTQTITNGIDLDGEGGLVWIKNRDAGDSHVLTDTERGATEILSSDSTAAEATDADTLTGFNSDGFAIGADVKVNTNTEDYASWTFRKAPKFFDVVTYTGDGNTSQTISHNLGATPGLIIIKRTDNGSSWVVYHRSLGATDYLLLNSTAAKDTASTIWNDTEPTSSVFTVGSNPALNSNNGTYVAYLFAHNDGDGEFGESGDQDIIKCGSYTTDANGYAAVDLGFEPQWILTKASSSSDSSYGAWWLQDNLRGWPARPSASPYLRAESSGAENNSSAVLTYPTATGFVFDQNNVGFTSETFIYIAIRRGPMKTPESGTEVFEPFYYTSDGGADRLLDGGFTVDAALNFYRSISDGGTLKLVDRLRGYATGLATHNTNAESTRTADYQPFPQTGQIVTSNEWDKVDGYGYGAYHFRRAPGFFDVVAYTGTGSTITISHSLGVVPELIIVKNRDASDAWQVYAGDETDYLVLNTNAATADNVNRWNDTAPTASVFTIGTAVEVNTSTEDYIAYLFATLDGISKVFSVTKSSGSDATVDCGFSAGARFVLLKRTDSTGDWYVWDTERGIVAGDDPYLLLNSTAAEVTNTDYIDPDSSGFVIVDNGLADGDYIGLAIA